MSTVKTTFWIKNNSQRVIFQDGMPTSVADLSKEIAKQCNLQGSFRLQFMDPDFEDDFMNLMSTSEIQDKSTLKVVSLTTSSDRDGSPIPHVDTSQNESACSSACSSPALSLLSCDTLVFSPPSTSGYSESSASLAPVSSSSIKSSAWPAEFTVPRFTYDAELKLEQGNAAFKTQGAFLSPDPKLKISILDGLAEEIVKYKLYPSDAEYGQVAEALIKKHPCLKERGSVTGYSGWKASLKYKLGNYRTKLRNIGYTEVTVNSIKHKPDGISSPAYRVKKPRKAEVNYCPSHPQGETDETLEAVRQTLLTEVKKKNNEKNVRMLMDKSFSIRRHEVIKEPLIADFKTRWPALFRKEEVCAEFERITTAPLVSRLFANMDAYIAKLMKIFASRGGVVGQRIKTLLVPTTQTDDIEVKRECIIKSLCVYLNEDPSSLILEFMDTDGASTQEAIQKAVMGIYVIRYEGADVEDSPADVGVVLEGEKVLQDLCSVPYATAMLLGLIYGLNLSYPPEL
ncbi:sterile alpha motif domain-containing protein 3-like isoform X1 [Onychostoma macrolepis]|uniref:sterile alpha motif domain-containing protein 3-like isoform X1 n=2 Tax=Onychostoma macrolepis TaxID=369639 RepID=UPI00272D6FFB|nr:sterile alpha motif domain-containing protein 3-like isoform X1 [Onychostoma macrolepis]